MKSWSTGKAKVRSAIIGVQGTLGAGRRGLKAARGRVISATPAAAGAAAGCSQTGGRYGPRVHSHGEGG